MRDEIFGYASDEIKSVSLVAVGDLICEADFIHEADLSRRKTDLTEKAKSYDLAFSGGNNRARTYDPLLVRQMLSQLSYAPIGADYGARTRHLHLGKVALYQMS